MAKLFFDLNRLRRNLTTVQNFCNSRQLTLLPVTKLFQSRPDLLDALNHPALIRVADVQPANLARLNPDCQHERVLLRSRRQDAAAIAAHATRVFLSDPSLGRVLSEARLATGQPALEVTVMLEAGDLRDGVPLDQAAEVFRHLAQEPGLQLTGAGINLGCLDGTLPTEAGLGQIADTFKALRRTTGLELPSLSLGGTVFWNHLRDRPLPPEFTELRIGEALYFAWNTSLQDHVPELLPDVFRLDLEVLEVWQKNVPAAATRGISGYNAFGEVLREPFAGPRWRAVLDGGENFAPFRALSPLRDQLTLIGATHEYLVMDCTEASPALQPGEVLSFRPGYEAIARAFLSPYLHLETGENP